MEGQGWQAGLGWPEPKSFKDKVLERLSKIKNNVKDKYNARVEQFTEELGHHSISGPYAKIDDFINKGRAAAVAVGETTCHLASGLCGDARDSVRDWWYSPNAEQIKEIKRAQEQERINFENERKDYMELRERMKKHDEDQVRRFNINDQVKQQALLQQYADLRDKEYPKSYEEYLANKLQAKGSGGKSKKRRNNKVSKRRRRKSNRFRQKSNRRTRK
jgi:hypothetical protein